MKIHEMNATFGYLNNARLELGDGLNIIQAPNESGKSTWSAFIRTMLYGINTADRDKAGYLSDKTRYRPWNDSAMGGTMSLTVQDSDITIQRSSLGKAPMKKFEAVYTGTGETVDGLTGENAGQILTGVSEAVFVRSAFIGQSSVRIDRAPELERRIAAIVSSGEETTSYSEADSRLRAWLRKLQYNRSGEIPALAARIDEAKERLEALKKANDDTVQIKDSMTELERECAVLETETSAFDRIEKLEERRRAETAEAEAKQAEEAAFRAAEAAKNLGAGTDIKEKLRKGYEELGTYAGEVHTGEQRRTAAEEMLAAAKEVAATSPFDGRTPERAAEYADKARETAAGKKKNTLTAAVLAAAAVLCLIAALLLSGTARTVLFIAMGVLLAGAAVLAVLAAGFMKTEKLIIDACGESDPERLAQMAEDYKKHCDRREKAELDLEDAVSAHDEAKRLLAEKTGELLEQARQADPDIPGVEGIPDLMDRIDSAKRESERLSMAAAFARSRAEELAARLPEADDAGEFIMPRYDRETTSRKLAETRVKLEEARAEYNRMQGQSRVMGDPVVISGEILALESELKDRRREYDALELAIDMLANANTEIQTRFSPMLSRAAGDIFRKLTGGRYDMLVFDRSFDAQARQHDEPIGRDVISLSAGTADQVYLAFRLAVCELAVPDEDPCPLILDDALTNFDDTRMGFALDYLRELSEKRQVILFTCHSRESGYFAGDSAVKINIMR